MTAPTFSPPVEPSGTTSVKLSQRKLVAAFGDGYTQRAPDGIKTNQLVWSIVWTTLGNTFAETIMEFFETVGETTSFWWTDLRGNTLKYTASNVEWDWDQYNSNTIKATLTQDLNG